MSKTVVGLFRSTSEAQEIKTDLVNQGFSPDNVRIVAQGDQSYAASAGAGSATPATTEGGFGATIGNFFRSLTGGDGNQEQQYTQKVSSGGALVAVTVADSQADEVADLLEDYGAENIQDQASAGGAGSSATGMTAGTGQTGAASGQVAVPIVEEELQIGKRQVQRGGVRVFSHLVETPVEENIRLREERVRVNRRPVNRPATEQDFSAFKEGTVELTETNEEAVVSKQARVVEEVVVGKDVTERTQTVKDNVRHTEVEVEEIDSDRAVRPKS